MAQQLMAYHNNIAHVASSPRNQVNITQFASAHEPGQGNVSSGSLTASAGRGQEVLQTGLAVAACRNNVTNQYLGYRPSPGTYSQRQTASRHSGPAFGYVPCNALSGIDPTYPEQSQQRVQDDQRTYDPTQMILGDNYPTHSWAQKLPYSLTDDFDLETFSFESLGCSPVTNSQDKPAQPSSVSHSRLQHMDGTGVVPGDIQRDGIFDFSLENPLDEQLNQSCWFEKCAGQDYRTQLGTSWGLSKGIETAYADYPSNGLGNFQSQTNLQNSSFQHFPADAQLMTALSPDSNQTRFSTTSPNEGTPQMEMSGLIFSPIQNSKRSREEMSAEAENSTANARSMATYDHVTKKRTRNSKTEPRAKHSLDSTIYHRFSGSFQSSESAEQHLSSTNWKPPRGINFPETDGQKMHYVQLIYAAMVDFSAFYDNPVGKSKNRMLSQQYPQEYIEARCWEVVSTAIDLHTHGSNLCFWADPTISSRKVTDVGRNGKGKEIVTKTHIDQTLDFRARIDMICQTVREFKSACCDVLDGIKLRTVVYGPNQTWKTKYSNLNSNDNRKDVYEWGQETKKRIAASTTVGGSHVDPILVEDSRSNDIGF